MKNDHYILKKLFEADFLTTFDFYFAETLDSLFPNQSEIVLIGAALTSRAVSDGHICLDLTRVQQLFFSTDDLINLQISLPSISEWKKQLRNSPLVSDGSQNTPLILNQNYLYLLQYWYDQQKIITHLIYRAQQPSYDFNQNLLHTGLNNFFPTSNIDQPDMQAIAAVMAVMRNLTIITGGPGTGKTSLVVKIIVLLQEQAIANKKSCLRFLLLAPTGKAASRLSSAIQLYKKKLTCSTVILEKIPEKAATVHRQLRSQLNHQDWDYDVVIIDEVSMIDLSLMKEILESLHDQTRLILLGDKNQLASVEAGSVFGDICNAVKQHQYDLELATVVKEITDYNLPSSNKLPSLARSIIQLNKNYRFKNNPEIAQLSKLIQSGNSSGVENYLRQSLLIKTIDYTLNPQPQFKFLQELKNLILSGYQNYLRQQNPFDALKAAEEFRILCTHRLGKYGSQTINYLIENFLKAENLINNINGWYHGQLIMITQNDYTVNLFNGDTGIIFYDNFSSKKLRAFFTHGDQLRSFPLFCLPKHETVYAMTIHKSQGTEFNQVVLILPEYDSTFITRELIYTAVTRAKNDVTLLSPIEILKNAIQRSTIRSSGLIDVLKKDSLGGNI